MADEHGNYDPLTDLGPLLAAVLNYDMTSAAHYAGRLAVRTGICTDDSAGVIAGELRKALGLAANGGDPVGTVTDLRTQEPRTVTRDGKHLVIPALRLDAAGCELLRKILVGEAPDLAAEPEPPLEATDIAYDRTHPDPYAKWVNGEPPWSASAAQSAGPEGTYKVEGKDGFDPDADFYPIGEWPSYGEALEAARGSLEELNLSQPDAGGQAGIQDRVYVVRPDGCRQRVFS